MTAVLHVLDEPLDTRTEILRLLAPGGVFLLNDWVRQPLAQYIEMMMQNVPPEREVVMLNHEQIRAECFCAYLPSEIVLSRLSLYFYCSC
jgi:hypothetical protein